MQHGHHLSECAPRRSYMKSGLSFDSFKFLIMLLESVSLADEILQTVIYLSHQGGGSSAAALLFLFCLCLVFRHFG